MLITNSYELYDYACSFYKKYRNKLSDIKAEEYYLQMVLTMFYELIVKRNSELLSWICCVNDINTTVVNFDIKNKKSDHRMLNNPTDQKYNNAVKYDLYPLILGLNYAFLGQFDNCRKVFEQCKKDIFQENFLNNASDYKTWATDQLRILDGHIGQVRSAAVQTQSQAKQDKEKTNIILRTYDTKRTEHLNKLAETRKVEDFQWLEKIQNLQVSLQTQLKQITDIREGIAYNTTQEAISQFLSLFRLIHETLQYHPDDRNKHSYQNLIESCEEFLANIEQSLSLLGVKTINDDRVFDPERHKAVSTTQLTRSANINKVVKIGFEYKGKVLEKAEVELI